MTKHATLSVAKPMFGDQLYQERAKRALPILVRQACAQKTIYYQNLADELGMPNARNLNYVLGSVGTTLIELGKEWGEALPKIQSLVLSQTSGQPGTGYFGGGDEYRRRSKRQREARLENERSEIYSYPKWNDVLKALGIQPLKLDVGEILEKARYFRSGGESEAHLRLKQAIANDPSLVGLPRSTKCVGMEYPLPSGDSLDVYFERGCFQYAVEVKSAVSDTADIARGLFQCIKYQAVLESWRAAEGREADVEVILALEAKFPEALMPLRNALQIIVKDCITTPNLAELMT